MKLFWPDKLIFSMPTSQVKSIASKSGKSVADIEKYVARAKKSAKEQGQEDNWAYIMGTVKRMAGISESTETLFKQAESYQSFFYRLREDYGALETIVGNLTREYPLTKLWVEEKTFGIIVRAIVVDPEHREKGIGTEAIKRIIEYADDVNKPVALTPSKQYGGYMNRLVSWAKSLGFVYNKGKTKDYRLPETMIRPPQKRGIADIGES